MTKGMNFGFGPNGQKISDRIDKKTIKAIYDSFENIAGMAISMSNVMDDIENKCKDALKDIITEEEANEEQGG